MENPSRKPDSGAWNSIDDALETIYSLSRVTKGSIPKSTDHSTSDHSSESSRIENGSTYSCENPSTIEEIADNEFSYSGGGRGKLLKGAQEQFSREKLDTEIHSDLRKIFGPGFSNEVIENYFDSACSSSSEPVTQETGVFSDCDIEKNESKIDFVVGESNIMKNISATEKFGATKKKFRRCRNAVVLSLTEKKLSNETEQDTEKAPVLKGPDLFLPNKSYSTVLSAAKGGSSLYQADKPIFTAEDFPTL